MGPDPFDGQPAGGEKGVLGGARILVVDPSRLVAEALRAALERSGARVVSAAALGPPAPPVVGGLPAETEVDVVLADLDQDTGSQGALARNLLRRFPGTPVVAMVGAGASSARGWPRSGLAGIVPKQASLPDLIRSIRRALDGEPPVVLALPHRPRGRRSGATDRHASLVGSTLTPREQEVLALLATGAGSREIARRLGASANTVRTHVQSILTKLQVHSRLEAVAFASRHGLLASPGEAIRR
jgi:two-component system nitrate/nitrite response regulator NarL